jgi:ABC-2 type transport system permease protein
MMFAQTFLFELKYRKSRSITYIYFFLIVVLCFFVVTSPTAKLVGAVGQVKVNSPYVISALTIIISFVTTIITSAVMGVVIVRDFDHKMEPILFTTRVQKFDYLFGRFAGSFVVLLLIHCAVCVGLMIAFSLGQFVPWETTWKHTGLLPFNAWHYFQPFIVFLIPNLFITSSLFFMVGALGRSSILIYTQGVLLITFYQIASLFIQNLESSWIAPLLDPFGVQTVVQTIQYWTAVERNSQLISFDGMIMYNRLLWMGIAILGLLFTYFYFSFTASATSRFSKSSVQEKENSIATALKSTPSQTFGFLENVRLVFYSSVLYFRMITKEIYFLAIVAAGLFVFILNAINLEEVYGTGSYPTTFAILGLFTSFNPFSLAITIFYSGELIWKERTINFNQIVDTLPLPGYTNLLSKVLSLVWIHMLLFAILIGSGVLVQVAHGYFKFNFSAYFGTLYISTLSQIVLYTLLFMFIQVLVNNKFLGFVFCVSFIVIQFLLTNGGLEHNLFLFASGSLDNFSDMNKYGHFVLPFIWFRTYWLSFSLLIFGITILFIMRGSENGFPMRWRMSKERLTVPLLIFILFALTAFIFSGSFIFYNTNIINAYVPTLTRLKTKADFEKNLKQYSHLIQPRIVEANLVVDLFPYDRLLEIEGFYYLKNKSSSSIKEIHIHYRQPQYLSIQGEKFDRQVSIKQKYDQWNYFIYELQDVLAPGDSIKMNFKFAIASPGFVEGNSNTQIVYNGSFIPNDYFPGIGYDENLEIKEDQDRLDNELNKTNFVEQHTDKKEITNIYSQDADRIRFDATINTADDQLAIAPGRMVRQWQDKGRNHFQYKSEKGIHNSYSIASARYLVKRDKWKGIDLEVYYHQEHEANVNRMIVAMKDALDYCSENYSPYQYSVLRIVEFPRYSSPNYSSANTITVSEGGGFVLKVGDPSNNIDLVYAKTVYEVAVQWWGQQVAPASGAGSSLISESLAQYTALMIMKNTFPQAIMEKYLKYELNQYLKGRAVESRKEQSLLFTQQQKYIGNNKASLIFYALQDYVGENNLNKALKDFNEEWTSGAKKDFYPTSSDLMKHIRKIVPDSLQYLIGDMFENITFFENKIISGIYEEAENGQYEVTLNVVSEKILADSLGRERTVPMNDWIDIGVYAEDAAGKTSLCYLKKHYLTKKETAITLYLKQRPVKAGIDPLHKLIDRHAPDNITDVKKLIDIGNTHIE